MTLTPSQQAWVDDYELEEIRTMAFEKKEGQGAIFKNTKKTQANHPDYRGDCLINGTECWISAWIKDGKQGKYMSLAIAPKDAPSPRAEPQKQDEDSDIPF